MQRQWRLIVGTAGADHLSVGVALRAGDKSLGAAGAGADIAAHAHQEVKPLLFDKPLFRLEKSVSEGNGECVTDIVRHYAPELDYIVVDSAHRAVGIVGRVIDEHRFVAVVTALRVLRKADAFQHPAALQRVAAQQKPEQHHRQGIAVSQLVGSLFANNGIITDIDVCEEYCTVNLEDTKNNDEDGNPLQYSYKLQFIVDMIDSGMIKPKATKN